MATTRSTRSLKSLESNADPQPDLSALLARQTSPSAQQTKESQPEVVDQSSRQPDRKESSSGRPKKRSGVPKSASAQVENPDRSRSSSVHVPATLMPALRAYRDEHQLTNGDVVIRALEATHSRLRELIQPAFAGGEGLFDSRPSQAIRHDGDLTSLNVRLRNKDYPVIERLVADSGASSRSHLISVALAAFLDHD